MCFDKELQPMDCPGSSKAVVTTTDGRTQQLQYPKCSHIIMPPVPGGWVFVWGGGGAVWVCVCVCVVEWVGV